MSDHPLASACGRALVPPTWRGSCPEHGRRIVMVENPDGKPTCGGADPVVK